MTEWVAEQVEAEGFTVTVDLQDGDSQAGVVPYTSPDNVESMSDFPKLDAPEQKAAALKLVQKPESEEEDTDEDGGDDYNGKKDWLN